jgi:hypothetical protein
MCLLKGLNLVGTGSKVPGNCPSLLRGGDDDQATERALSPMGQRSIISFFYYRTTIINIFIYTTVLRHKGTKILSCGQTGMSFPRRRESILAWQ